MIKYKHLSAGAERFKSTRSVFCETPRRTVRKIIEGDMVAFSADDYGRAFKDYFNTFNNYHVYRGDPELLTTYVDGAIVMFTIYSGTTMMWCAKVDQEKVLADFYDRYDPEKYKPHAVTPHVEAPRYPPAWPQY